MKFFKIQSKEEKQLDEIIDRLQMNLSNNYKDSAQANLAELRQTYDEMCSQGKLKEKPKAEYGQKLAVYAEKLKGYSHKDQKPYWH